VLCNFGNDHRVKNCLLCTEPIQHTIHRNRPAGYYYRKLCKKYQEFIKKLVINAIKSCGYSDTEGTSIKHVVHRLCCDLANVLTTFPSNVMEPNISDFEINTQIGIWASNIKHIGNLNKGFMYKKYCEFIYIELMLKFTFEPVIMI
jgi:hypothetical protein